MTDRSHLAIGEVLSLLRDEFPDITISKIRFLESQGLVDPERTPSGYRKFYEADVERLRWILLQQKELFLPLKVIKDRLGDLGDGAEGGDGASGPGDDAGSIGHSEPDVGRPSHGALSLELTDGFPELVEQSAPSVTPSAEHLSLDGEHFEASSTPDGDSLPTPSMPHEEGTSDLSAPLASAPLPSAPLPSAPLPSAPEPSAPEPSAPEPAAPEPAAPEPAAPGPPEQVLPLVPSVAMSPSRALSEADPDSLSIEELASAAGMEVKGIEELEDFGLIASAGAVGGAPYFDGAALQVAKTAAAFARHGVEARHLRAWRNGAEREASLFEQIVMPLLRQRNPQARHKAEATLDELVHLGGDLRSALVDQAVGRIR